MLSDIIGAKLIHIDENVIILSKDGKKYYFDIETEHGSRSGYSEVETTLFISEEEIKRNPVITSIDTNNDDSNGHEEIIKITLFGENKPLAEITACAGSGSGECYGACAYICCRETKIKEYIVEW